MKTLYIKKTTTLAPSINTAKYSTKCNSFSENIESIAIEKSEKPGKILTKMEHKCRDLYKNLPYNSVLKRQDSFVTYRISLSDTDVIHILYDLNSEKDLLNIFSIPDNLNVPGIYCFLSKDKTFFYIGSVA